MKLALGNLSCGAALVGALSVVACSEADTKAKDDPLGDAGNKTDSGRVADSGGKGPCVPDESTPVPATRCTTDTANTALPQCRQWTKVELPGTVCGNGSQYKFFVNYSDTSNNLVVMLEPGGACWDYGGCTGENGIAGAANPEGILDDHMASGGSIHPGIAMDYVHPQIKRDPDKNPMSDWNYVFVPYCTGDVHTGNNVITYTSTVTGATVDFHHAGYRNMTEMVPWMAEQFTDVPRLLVTGCSAGGAGALVNYHFIRSGVATQCGYLLDDAGPIFPSAGNSGKVHQKIRASWNVNATLDELEPSLGMAAVDAIGADFGAINTVLADNYPQDRLSITYLQQDFNYSLYSYSRFYDPPPTNDDIHRMWWEDTQDLMGVYDTRDNLAYFIPYGRPGNCSHCASIVSYFGTEIQEKGVDLDGFVKTLLDNNAPLESYVESEQVSEKLTLEAETKCRVGF